MRSYLSFAALLVLFAVATYWFATHRPTPRADHAEPAAPRGSAT